MLGQLQIPREDFTLLSSDNGAGRRVPVSHPKSVTAAGFVWVISVFCLLGENIKAGKRHFGSPADDGLNQWMEQIECFRGVRTNQGNDTCNSTAGHPKTASPPPAGRDWASHFLRRHVWWVTKSRQFLTKAEQTGD
jgi:hypothetical protein